MMNPLSAGPVPGRTGRIGGSAAIEALQKRKEIETDQEVREEIATAP